MIARRRLVLAGLVALLHGLFYIWYQRPDWYVAWPDQDGYRRLGQVLATTGKFTRFPDAREFVPEVLRTPLYPMVLAGIYRVFGTGQLPVALAQTLMFVAICLLTYGIARRVTSDAVAAAAALVVALFSPIPYFAAVVMTEVWTTLMFTAAMWIAVRCASARGFAPFAWLGFVAALTALSRPVFVLLAFALAAVGVIVFPLVRVRERPGIAKWGLTAAVFALTMLPWLTYNYVTLGRFTLSPAGGVGRGLWEGSWQATWRGRVQDELTKLGETVEDPAELDRRIAAVAAREGTEVGPMLEYVHQWKDIRRIWTEPVDPNERAAARVRADDEYRRVAIENLRRTSFPQLLKRLARGVFVLWAGEIPIRYTDINDLPPIVIRACWIVQAALMLLALAGVWAVALDHRAEACILAAPIVYVTAVHFPLLTEARQSLPAMPTVLALSTIGAAHVAARIRGSRRSLTYLRTAGS